MLFLVACTRDPPLRVHYFATCECACGTVVCADSTFSACRDEGDTAPIEEATLAWCQEDAVEHGYVDCQLVPVGDGGQLVAPTIEQSCEQYEPAPMN